MRKNFVKIVDSIEIDKINTRELYDEAVKQSRSEDPVILNQDTLYRWMVNTVRHSHSSYEVGLKELHKLNNSEVEYNLYKNAVLDKISYEYPNLEDECIKQKEPIKMVKVIKKKKRGKKNGRRKRS